MSEWKTYKLGELGTLARGKSKHRPRDASFLYGGKYPFIQTGDIKAANHKILNHIQTYSEEGLKQSKLWPAGTICITIAANIADTAILTYPACFPDSVIGFIADERKCDIDFIEYLLQYTKRNIQSHSIGSVQDNINLGTFENFTMEVPNLITQKSIASILSSLDDKIELNLQMNQTLETMAQTIFKEWFVNFNFPGFDGELVDGLPRGWKMGKLNEVARIEIGRTPPRMEEHWFSTEPKDIKWISIKDLGLSGVYIFNTSEYLTQEAVEKFKIPVIPKNTVVLSFKLTIGRLAITTERMLSNEAIAQINSDMFSPEFIYTYLKTYNWNGLGSTSSIATAINSKIIREMEILIPENEVENHFREVVKPIFKKIKSTSQEIETLSQIRDSLLPKLMTGKIEIKE